MHIDRSQYCQVHLEELQTHYQIDDWFSFLDTPHRIIHVMRNCYPVRMDDSDVMDGIKATWDSPASTLCGNFYGLWPNETKAERFIAELMLAMSAMWNKDGCIWQPEMDISKKIMSFYEYICSYEDEETLKADALRLIPDHSNPISRDDLIYWMEHLPTNVK